MARIRSLHPSFAKSDDIVALAKVTRLHFAMLWCYADDYGKGRDDARLIKAELWPLDNDITLRKVESMQAELARHGRIVRYQAGGKPYFQVTNWGTWQHPQKKGPDVYPSPTEATTLPFDSGSGIGTVREGDSNGTGGLSPVVEGRGEGGVDGGSGSGEVAQAPPLADDLLREWYDHRDPKPVLGKNAWPGMRSVVKKALDNGHPPERVRVALRSVDVVSAGWLEPALRKAKAATNGTTETSYSSPAGWAQ